MDNENEKQEIKSDKQDHERKDVKTDDNESKKSKKKKCAAKIFLVAAIAILIITVFYQFNEIQDIKIGYDSLHSYFIIMDFLIAVAIFFLYIYLSDKHVDREISLYEKYLEKELESSDRGEDEKDVIRFMINNNKEITEYFEISKEQEKKSYNISIGCAVAGVFVLAFSVGAIFFNVKIEASIITMIAGAITEVVSGIVLWIHNKSAMQLNYYYDCLHENEKFLSAVQIAYSIKDVAKKEQMLMEIIRAQIRVKGEKEKRRKIIKISS